MFRLPEISIQYIMHLGLPSGEISESDLRRFYPSTIPRLQLATSPTSPTSLSRVALFALVAFLPLGPDLFRCPATSPTRQDRLGGGGANLPCICHISQAVALRQHWQCLWLRLHWLGYPIRQCIRRPGRIACKGCRIDAHCGTIALFSCARQTCTARYFSEARSFPAG